MIFRRARFAEVIDRQVELFVSDHADVIEEAGERLARYDAAARDEAEELYGDYVDAVETGTEILAEVRDHYATSLAGAESERYVSEFNDAIARRLPVFALEIESR